MSCTNNSIISATFVSPDTASNGRRLSFQQRTDTKWDSTIGAGDVIRYDVINAKFVKSIANPNYPSGEFNLSNAEVVGVVESIAKTDGITYATVVINGLMNYPGITGETEDGLPGGTDIWFLSTEIPGGISYSVEEQRGYIAKPVLQYCPVSGTEYNAIVINYLGYETSESEQASVLQSTSTVGDLKTVDFASQIPAGWIDASVSQYLSVSDYGLAYQKYGTKYGAYEQLTVNGTSSYVSSLLNASIRPIDSRTKKPIGDLCTVISVDSLNNKITIQHTTRSFFYTSANSNYEVIKVTATPEEAIPLTNQNKPQTLKVTSGVITHFKPPVLSTNLQTTVNVANQIQPFNTKTLLRVKPDAIVSYLPQKIQFKDIELTGTLGTSNINDVDTKVISLETRIQNIEQRLGI